MTPHHDDATIICLTPVKNEAWILDRFLGCAGLWADHIVIADQRSTDGSREIIRKHEKAILVDNPDEGWNEITRQNLLIDTAREIPARGKRILIALDADEALSANWADSPDWQRILSGAPGTVFGFQWANVFPGHEKAWLPPDEKWFCFVDDGSQHSPEIIHGPRLPQIPHHRHELLSDIKVLHFQYTDWERMLSKQRWYQVWERINMPHKRPVQIFRQYNHMFGIPPGEISPLKSEWYAAYERAGIDMRRVNVEDHYRWDGEVLDLLLKRGTAPFRKIDIWDVDWGALENRLGAANNGTTLADPRSRFEKAVHRWLRKTQPSSRSLPVRGIQQCLRIFGW